MGLGGVLTLVVKIRSDLDVLSSSLRSDLQGKRLVVLAPAMVLPFLGALVYFILAGDHPAAPVFYGITKMFTLVWPAIALGFVVRQPISFRFGVQVGMGRSLFEGTLVGLILGGIIGFSMSTPLGSLVEDSAGAIRQKATDLGFISSFWTFALVLSFGHSLLEEYYWRGFVFGQLRHVVPLFMAHLLAGVAFALHHLIVCTQYFPLGLGLFTGSAVVIGGMVWSWLYVRHGHFYGAWVSHLIVDLILMTIGAQLILE
ncbi:MAG: hypothetical protein M2R45_04328 [Verrucomicrobia subdivision 3 bacterium]|nr:hypothetical protein [Limisphaerales bacterium]MCS1417244.1 hypothetical protein [Limisphaerales bacterium]